MEEGEDPFGALIKYCEPTASQELKLQVCPFARESETFADSDSTPSSALPLQPGIIMVSPPGSTSIDQSTLNENEEFQTPPEHAHSSSQDMTAPSPAAVDSHIKPVVDENATAVRGSPAEGQGAVDLGKESDSLGLSEPSMGRKTDGSHELLQDKDGADINVVRGGEEFGSNFGRLAAEQVELDEPVAKRIRVYRESVSNLDSHTVCIEETERIEVEAEWNINMSTEAVDLEWEGDGEKSHVERPSVNEEVEQNKNMNTVVVDLECEENGEKIASSEERTGVYDDSLTKEGGEGRSIKDIDEGKSIEDLDKYIYTGNGNRKEKGRNVDDGVGRKRELPFSMRSMEESAGRKEEVVGSGLKNGFLEDLLVVLEAVLGEVDNGCEDADFLETAKSRGMTFPRPRWRPPDSPDE